METKSSNLSFSLVGVIWRNSEHVSRFILQLKMATLSVKFQDRRNPSSSFCESATAAPECKLFTGYIIMIHYSKSFRIQMKKKLGNCCRIPILHATWKHDLHYPRFQNLQPSTQIGGKPHLELANPNHDVEISQFQ